jgi:hypothetical protein
LVPRTATPYSRLAIISGVTILPATRLTKDLADRLVKDEFDRDARIGAGEYGREGFWFVDGMLFQDGQIVLDRGHLVYGETLVAPPAIPAKRHRESDWSGR